MNCFDLPERMHSSRTITNAKEDFDIELSLSDDGVINFMDVKVTEAFSALLKSIKTIK